LADGAYDVAVEAGDVLKRVATAAAPGKLLLDRVASSAPTIDSFLGAASPATITGTWPEGDATKLQVKVGETSYQLGAAKELTSAAGKWTLALPSPLAEGTYPVSAKAADAAGNVASAESQDAIVIDTTPAGPPTVDAIRASDPISTITGTWDSANAKSLRIGVAGQTYELGKDASLTAPSPGKWQLDLPVPLPPGSYDVTAETGDAVGNISSAAAAGSIVVEAPTPPAAEPPVAEQPVAEAPPPALLAVPTVNRAAGNSPTPSISGTLDQTSSKLTVAVGGKAYELGRDPALAATDGAWILRVPEPLKDGIYDVVVTATDATGKETRDASVAEITIDTTPPVAPTVNTAAGNNASAPITGTMAPDAKSLTVNVNDKIYTLGTDAALSTAGDGTWSLKPEAPLPEGNTDIVVTAADEFGNTSTDASLAEILIDLTGPKPPEVTKATSDDPATAIAGTVGGDAKSLKVTVAGKAYTLGQDANLTLEGGAWNLKPSEPLKIGIYDVVAEAADAYGNTAKDQTVAEVEIIYPPAKAPTVNQSSEGVARPLVSGTWDEANASSLAVTLDGTTYTLGTDENLTSNGAGAWSLALAKPLMDGTYDVAVETMGKNGTAVQDATMNELLVDAAGPASPTVKLYAGDTSPASLSGTWAEGDAVSLSVSVNSKSASLGQDASLKTDGQGNWTWTLAEALGPGSYDVKATNADKTGRQSSDQTRFEVLVKGEPEAAPQPEPAPPPQPTPAPAPAAPAAIDCGAELSKLLILNPLNFATAKAGIRSEDQPTIAKAAELIAACPDLKFEVAGHTDSDASAPYNQALSERRAVAVRRALIAVGVAPERMNAVGYGETKPLASNETEEGKTVNRRIEITVMQ
jgi:outer membrane protein OmpA-like peptidoglycan-associated protein